MASDPIINDASIRRHYDEQSKKWYFSVVDVVAITSSSNDPRNYWKVLKSRLYKANPQLVTKCNQLKMKSKDGKSYLTDTADTETMLEIVATISSDFSTPLRLYFEKIESTYPHAKEYLFKETSPSEEVELAVDMYQTSTTIIVESFVAGSQVEDIFISVNYKSLTIRGKRVPLQKESPLLEEIYWGNFSRTIDLPVEIQIDMVEATTSHGFLKILLPKIDTFRTRIIKIKSV